MGGHISAGGSWNPTSLHATAAVTNGSKCGFEAGPLRLQSRTVAACGSLFAGFSSEDIQVLAATVIQVHGSVVAPRTSLDVCGALVYRLAVLLPLQVQGMAGGIKRLPCKPCTAIVPFTSVRVDHGWYCISKKKKKLCRFIMGIRIGVGRMMLAGLCLAESPSTHSLSSGGGFSSCSPV